MINLEILTEDKNLAAVCQLYWEVDNEYEFVHKISDLAKTANVDKKRLPSLVKESCNAIVPTWKCEDCGNPYVFLNRMFVTIVKEREKRRRWKKENRGRMKKNRLVKSWKKKKDKRFKKFTI